MNDNLENLYSQARNSNYKIIKMKLTRLKGKGTEDLRMMWKEGLTSARLVEKPTFHTLLFTHISKPSIVKLESTVEEEEGDLKKILVN